VGSGVRDVMESLGYDEREGYGSAGKLAGVWSREREARRKRSRVRFRKPNSQSKR
jgi:hypothetical protein